MNDNDTNTNEQQANMVGYTASIVAAFASHQNVNADALTALIGQVHSTLTSLGQPAKAPEETRQEPAVSIRKSIKPDYLVCLEDGKEMKMLKRYIMNRYNLTPDQYRAKWGLAKDYPMVAPNHAQMRSELAKKIGLGARRSSSTTAPAPKATKAASTAKTPGFNKDGSPTKRRGRKPKSEQQAA